MLEQVGVAAQEDWEAVITAGVGHTEFLDESDVYAGAPPDVLAAPFRVSVRAPSCIRTRIGPGLCLGSCSKHSPLRSRQHLFPLLSDNTLR